MDDFPREKRLYTIDDMKEFANTSLTNYYDMLSHNQNEFEKYESRCGNETCPAEEFIVTFDKEHQNATSVNLTWNADNENYGGIFAIENNTEFR